MEQKGIHLSPTNENFEFFPPAEESLRKDRNSSKNAKKVILKKEGIAYKGKMCSRVGWGRMEKRLRNRKVLKWKSQRILELHWASMEEIDKMRIERLQELEEDDDHQLRSLVCEGLPKLIARFAQDIKSAKSVKKSQLVVYLERIERKILNSFKWVKIDL